MRRAEDVRTALAAFALIVMFSALHTCQAKRGCSAFGHSCFGGHGKRMDPSVDPASAGAVASSPEEVLYGGSEQAGLRDVVFTAPRSDEPPMSLLEAAAALRQHRQQEQQQEIQQQQQEERRRLLLMSLHQQNLFDLSPFLRQWLQSYRNSQDIRQNSM